MKKYLFGLIALVGIAVLSAFAVSNTDTKKPTNTYFYKYTGPANPIIDDIQDRTNYQRFELSCDDGDHVCGVYLDTDGIEGAYPDTDEFDEVKDELWTSEDEESSELPGQIIMKN